VAHAQCSRLDGNCPVPGSAQFRLLATGLPTPRVAQHQLGDQVQRRGRTVVPRGDLHENVARFDLGILHEDIEITILGEHARVQQFVFRNIGSAPRILRNQIRVGKCSVRIFIEHLQVGMRRRRIQVKIMLFHILAVIALGVGQTEQALFQNRVGAIPHS